MPPTPASLAIRAPMLATPASPAVPAPVQQLDPQQLELQLQRQHEMHTLITFAMAGIGSRITQPEVVLVGGYQCTCKTHVDFTSQCTRSLTADADGGIIGALRQLKYWVLLGQNPEVSTKRQHKGLWSIVVDRWRNGCCPTMAELDKMMMAGAGAAPAPAPAPAADLGPIEG